MPYYFMPCVFMSCKFLSCKFISCNFDGPSFSVKPHTTLQQYVQSPITDVRYHCSLYSTRQVIDHLQFTCIIDNFFTFKNLHQPADYFAGSPRFVFIVIVSSNNKSVPRDNSCSVITQRMLLHNSTTTQLQLNFIKDNCSPKAGLK